METLFIVLAIISVFNTGLIVGYLGGYLMWKKYFDKEK